MDFIMKNKKGQLSIEFILILTIVLLLLQIMILPMRDNAENTLESFTSIGYLDKASYDIKKTINILDNSSEGKLNLEVYIPKDANLYFDGKSIVYEVALDYNVDIEGVENCVGRRCTKTLPLDVAVNPLWSQNLSNNRYVLTFTKVSQNSTIDVNAMGMNR